MLHALEAHKLAAKQQTKEPEDIFPIKFDKLPISELHVHAEGGTLDQTTLNDLAQRHNRQSPTEIYGPDNTLTFKDGDFLDFLTVYDKAASYIEDENDITDVIYRYLQRCHEEGAIYVELSCSPDHVRKVRKTFSEVHDALTRQAAENVDMETTSVKSGPGVFSENLSYPAIVNALVAGIDKAKKEFGIEARILMVLLRHNGKDACMKTVEEIVSHPHPYVVGINMAGDEARFPAKDYAACYALAKSNGLKLTAHVGEHAGPETMRQAIEDLHLDRIGHGVQSARDETVMQYLKERNIGLEICPSSNVVLKLYPHLEQHPFKLLHDFGIKCSINSDDPTYFATSLGQEYRKVQAQWQLSFEQMIQLCKNSIEMSFAEAGLKRKLLAHIELYEAFHHLKQAIKPSYAASKTEQQLTDFQKRPTSALACELEHAVKSELFAYTGIKKLLEIFKDKLEVYQSALLSSETLKVERRHR